MLERKRGFHRLLNGAQNVVRGTISLRCANRKRTVHTVNRQSADSDAESDKIVDDRNPLFVTISYFIRICPHSQLNKRTHLRRFHHQA